MNQVRSSLAPTLDVTTKGLILAPNELMDLATLGERGWNALRGDLDFPVMLASRDSLEHNIELMSSFCAASGVDHAPHAKTAMSPQIINLQREAGVWGQTAATMAQVRTLYSLGVNRILLANVVVDRQAIEWLCRFVLDDPDIEFFCYVDSQSSVELLESTLRAAKPKSPLAVLVEFGYSGGRTGARTESDALVLARRVARSGQLDLAGFACFEGLIPGSDLRTTSASVDTFLTRFRNLATSAAAEGLVETDRPPILSAGGSSYIDLVVENLRPERLDFTARTVVRSGCYVTHDHGIYASTSPFASDRAETGRTLRPALSLLASVWSRPEPDLVIAGFGRRDVPTDSSLPVALDTYPSTDVEGFRVFAVNDQHAFVRVPPSSSIATGDLIRVGISHPCGAFDRWRFIPLIDSDYNVVGGLTTLF